MEYEKFKSHIIQFCGACGLKLQRLGGMSRSSWLKLMVEQALFVSLPPRHVQHLLSSTLASPMSRTVSYGPDRGLSRTDELVRPAHFVLWRAPGLPAAKPSVRRQGVN
jgi:hypothetical protein